MTEARIGGCRKVGSQPGLTSIGSVAGCQETGAIWAWPQVQDIFCTTPKQALGYYPNYAIFSDCTRKPIGLQRLVLAHDVHLA